MLERENNSYKGNIAEAKGKRLIILIHTIMAIPTVKYKNTSLLVGKQQLY